MQAGCSTSAELQTKPCSANSSVTFVPSYPERFKHQPHKSVGEPTTSMKERLVMGFIPKHVA